MATLPDILSHRQAVEDLATLAIRDLRAFWRTLGTDNPKQVAQLVRDYLPDLVAAYSLATSTVAADWYDDLRAAAVASMFTATTLEPPDDDQVQAAIGYALVGLFAADSAEVSSAPIERLSHLVENVVTRTDRQTVEANMAIDHATPRYARHASANACTFCRLLATRGAEHTYRTEESALRVTLGRRGGQKLGEKYHDNCHCTAVPVWGDSFEEAPYVSEWREAYKQAAAGMETTTDYRAILAGMRQILGSK